MISWFDFAQFLTLNSHSPQGIKVLNYLGNSYVITSNLRNNFSISCDFLTKIYFSWITVFCFYFCFLTSLDRVSWVLFQGYNKEFMPQRAVALSASVSAESLFPVYTHVNDMIVCGIFSSWDVKRHVLWI